MSELVDAPSRTPATWVQLVSWQQVLRASLPPVAFVAICVVSLNFGYLVFHVLAEGLSIAIAVSALMVATSSYRFTKNHFLVYLAVAIGWCAVLDTIHTLAFKGMGLLPIEGANAPTQLWIAARYLQAVALITAPLFLHRSVRLGYAHAAYGFAAATAVAAIAAGVFPQAYLDGSGLTQFKINSEYAIILMMVGALALFWRERALLPRKMLYAISLAILAMVLAEFAFTRYVSVYAQANMAGHLLKVIAYWFIYDALVSWTLHQPFAEQQAILNSHIVGFVKLKDRRFVWVNDAYAEMFGYSKEEMIGQPTRLVYPSDEAYAAFAQAAYPVMQRGEVFRTEIQYLRKNQTLGWYQISGGTLYPGSAETIWAFVDTTERRRAEEALRDSDETLRSILETTLDGFWRVDRRGRLLDVNAQYCRLSGYSRDELLGMRINDLVASEDVAETEAHIELIMEKGRDQFQSTHRRKDGSLWQIEVSATYSDVGGGQFLVFLRDITKREKARQELVAAREAAVAGNRAKSEFLANMSHEIRTPLNGVIGNIQLLEMSDLDAEQKEYLSAITQSSNNLLSLVNDILDLSKIEAEKVVLERVDFSLRSCFNSVVLAQRSRILKKGLSLSLDIGSEVPDALIGDGLRVKQILLNLLGNAIKFTDKGSIALSASVREWAGSNVLVELTVSDTGIGISNAVIGTLFQPFVQADSSMTRQYGGSGLGLAICQRIAELMGGSIGVESVEGAGSTFRVLLPFTVVERLVQKHDAPVPAVQTLWTGRVLKVLLVEDNELNRQFGVALLKKMGHQVAVAENGQEALAMLSGQTFDLVLMDIQMPIMDGAEALGVVRERERNSAAHLPVIALTAYALKGDQEKFLASGFDGYVSKPLEVKQLVSEMHKVLENA